MSALFAATSGVHQRALTLCGTFASTVRAAAYMWAMDPEERRLVIDAIPEHWGRGPSLATDDILRSRWAHL